MRILICDPCEYRLQDEWLLCPMCGSDKSEIKYLNWFEVFGKMVWGI